MPLSSTELTTHDTLRDGTAVTIRPIRPQDAAIEEAFVRALSPRSKYFRFMEAVRELTPQMTAYFTQVDQERDLALIAVVERDGAEIEIAVARYFTNPDGQSGEFAIVVADEWQRKGLGGKLLDLLTEHARRRGIKRMQGDVLSENRSMLDFVRQHGFTAHYRPDDAKICRIVKEL